MRELTSSRNARAFGRQKASAGTGASGQSIAAFSGTVTWRRIWLRGQLSTVLVRSRLDRPASAYPARQPAAESLLSVCDAPLTSRRPTD
jgi:hypothetical protein